jgi:hypothetical protein
MKNIISIGKIISKIVPGLFGFIFFLIACDTKYGTFVLDSGGLDGTVTLEIYNNGTVLFPAFEYVEYLIETDINSYNFKAKRYKNEKVYGMIDLNKKIILLPSISEKYIILQYDKDKIYLEDGNGEKIMFYRLVGKQVE